MEHSIRDVVRVVNLRSGFYGVVVGAKIIEDGAAQGSIEYAVVPLEGGSVWHLHESCVAPTDRGFKADVIEKAMASYVQDAPMPGNISLDDAKTLEALAKEGVATVGGIAVSFSTDRFAQKNCQIHRDSRLRMYWIRL